MSHSPVSNNSVLQRGRWNLEEENKRGMQSWLWSSLVGACAKSHLCLLCFCSQTEEEGCSRHLRFTFLTSIKTEEMHPPSLKCKEKNSLKPATFSSDPRNLQILWIYKSLKYTPVRSGRLSMPAVYIPGMYPCLTVGNLKAPQSSQGIFQIICSVISSNC